MSEKRTETDAASGRKPSRKTSMLLWVLAFLLMVVAAGYQRRTGPTRPLRGEVELAGETVRYSLLRSSWSSATEESAAVEVPDPFGGAVTGTLRYRRFRTDDPFTDAAMRRETIDDEPMFVGDLPAQPSAGKLEYSVTLAHGAETRRLPETSGETVVIRFKDHVPLGILLPHVLMMFFSVLFALRVGLGAIVGPLAGPGLVRVTLVGMTVGGMVLGPIVQKYAFGAFWTGFPYGGDWTDNKMLVMWLAWVFAAVAVEFTRRKRKGLTRGVVLLAAAMTIVAYVIPHSTRGSELDYSQVDRGVNPAEAIETGR